MADKIIIFDTTLRDGEQSPGASLNVSEKLEIARQLEKLNVDVIEAGFPVSSPAQFEAVKRISAEMKKTVVCALARAKEMDIKKAWEAIQQAAKQEFILFPALPITTSWENLAAINMVKRLKRKEKRF